MKKKRILLVAAAILMLSGCRISRSNIAEQTELSLEEAVTATIPSSVNINKGLISYYLEPSVGRLGGDRINSIFKIGGSEAVLNIDVSAVIADKYYSGEARAAEFRDIDTFPDQIYEKTGSFLSGTGIIKDYRCRLYQISKTRYGILIQTSNLVMAAVEDLGSVPNTAYEMMTILRSCRVDEEKVVTAYSQKELINYTKQTLEIFQKVYPESGQLQDLLDGN